jgi:Uma2 family endonuclease
VSTRAIEYREAIEHLPDGAALVFRDVDWGEYERLLSDLADRPRLRISYDEGRLEIMSPLPEHEEYKEFILRAIQVLSEIRGLTLETRGSATWRLPALKKGAEPDTCFYVANASRVIGKRTISLESDPPPDVVVEIDVTNESLGKFPIYAALGVPEIWRYDGRTALFYELSGSSYRIVPASRTFIGFAPDVLAGALDDSKHRGQTAALAEFRRRMS